MKSNARTALAAATASASAVAALAAWAAVRHRALQVAVPGRPSRAATRAPLAAAMLAPGAPVPPDLPPGQVMNLPGRGEVFVRDFGAPDGPAVLLLHGWTASADINFWPAYATLADSYRVIALDQRGHGRGLRSTEPFSLEDCADDAAALLRQLGVGRAIVVGYSMGGPVSLLLARRHPGTVAGLVLQATALEWRHTVRERAVWHLLPVMDVGLRAGAGAGFFDRVLRTAADEDPGLDGYGPWLAAEFQRATANDLVAAGRALSRYDARPWAGQLNIPAAVLTTTRDRLVRLAKQRELADVLRAHVLEIDADHDLPLAKRAAYARLTRLSVDKVALASGLASSGGRPQPQE
jgi:pimeloyl-ACP methyl ester carboxylesterase